MHKNPAFVEHFVAAFSEIVFLERADFAIISTGYAQLPWQLIFIL